MSPLNRTHSSSRLEVDPYSPYYRYRLKQDKCLQEMDDDFYVIGDRVSVDGFRNGSVAYFGEVEFASGDWVGVVLDEPTGNNNGKVHGREYFQCALMHGLFVRPHRVTRQPDSALGWSNTSSRVSTPISGIHRSHSRPNSSRSGSSTNGSYFYDDDYRYEQAPTVDALIQKLKSIGQQKYVAYRPSSSQDTHRDAPALGILKKAQRPQSTEPIGSNFERNASTRGTGSFVFNFRPKREQLNDFSTSETTRTSPNGRTVVDLSSEPVKLGDKVTVRTERGDVSGILRYLGQTNFATGEWAGIELDKPTGRNDGSVLGFRYFYCPKSYGLFVPAVRVHKYRGEDHISVPEFSSMKFTIKSPPPLTSRSPSNDERLTSLSNYSSGSTYSPTNDLESITRKGMYKLGGIDSGSRSSLFDDTVKFSDYDLEDQLRRSLQQPNRKTSLTKESTKPKTVKYTFSTSKYDGNPIARRTVEYE